MAPIERGDSVITHVFRHRNNWIAAQVIQFLLFGLWLLNDPLQLRGPLPAGEGLTRPQAVAVPAAMGAAGLLAMAVGWYPRVEVTGEQVVVRNPLRTIDFPSGVDAVDTRGRYVRVRGGGRWWRCWGLETSLLMQIRNSDRSSTRQFQSAVSARGHGSRAVGVRVRWRRPTAAELLVLAFWAGLVAFSIAH